RPSMRLNRAISECSLDLLDGLGIVGLDERGTNIARAFYPPVCPHWRLKQLRLVERMVEKDLFGQLIHRRLMVGAETRKAALVLVEAGHLVEALPQPIADLRAFGIRPINAPKFQRSKSSVFVAGRLHIFLGTQETRELKLVPNRPAQLQAEQHVRVLHPALAARL